MANFDTLKRNGVAACYAECIAFGLAPEEAESFARRRGADIGCDMYQIERGIKSGKVIAATEARDLE